MSENVFLCMLASRTVSFLLSFLGGFGRLFKLLLGATFLLVLVVIIVSIPVYTYFAKDLPKLDRITDFRPRTVSEVTADDGTKIGEFWEECRYLVAYSEIPPLVIQAFVASEDARFWEHRGIDIRSIVRAFIENLRSGRVVQGGSTITQQITRSLLLTPERSLARKAKEALLATQIERNLAKEQILYLYLNQIFLGNRAYGIEAAARNYFHKTTRELNLAEISMIAGLPSAPSQYSPLIHADMAKKRQLYVLDQMVERNFITRDEAQAAWAQPLTLYRAGTDKDFNARGAPWFVEEVRRHLEETFGPDLLHQGGLKIETTASIAAHEAASVAIRNGLHEIARRRSFRGPIAKVPPSEIVPQALQIHHEILMSEGTDSLTIPSPENASLPDIPLRPDRLYRAIVTGVDGAGNPTIRIGVKKGVLLPEGRVWAGRHQFEAGEVYWVRTPDGATFSLDQEPEIEGALLSFETSTGEVKAVVGGYSFERSEFNRATQAMRQPGSAFKPIVYSAALDKGYRPSTTVSDSPIVYQVGRDDFWEPKNYGGDYSGAMTVRSALTHSVNVIAVKVFHDIGVHYTLAYARKLGITSPLNKYLSSALGASDLTLKELARAYGTFPRGGVRPELIFIRRITDRDGKVLLENPNRAIDLAKAFESVPTPESDAILPELAQEAERVIEREGFRLSADEQKILYGAVIPKGHVITPQTSFLMVNLLRDVVERGTGWKAKALGRPVAGKTGTTNDESDAWFVGFTPDHLAGVWVGHDSRKPIGPKMTGGVVSAPIWLTYMQEYLKERPTLNFPVPSNVQVAGIDSMTGGSAVAAFKPPPLEEIPAYEPGQVPASRAVDFLFEDLKNL